MFAKGNTAIAASLETRNASVGIKLAGEEAFAASGARRTVGESSEPVGGLVE
jgi:hypothetical protein